ncbi:MAG: hypothetical protein KDD25_05585 [Bdellovibrionales bacterium]|nr:hypothetical protein [Bdellovibrionales bacterium]
MRSLLKTKFGQSLKNEKGVAGVLAVIVISFTIVTTLSTVYIYLVNRAKYHAKIREAYQMSQVMEEFGKSFRQAYDSAQAYGGSANTTCGTDQTRIPSTAVGGVNFCLNGGGNTFTVQYLNQTYYLESLKSYSDQNSGNAQTWYTRNSSNGASLERSEDSLWASWSERLFHYYSTEAADQIETVASHAVPFLNLKVDRPDWVMNSAQAAIASIGGETVSINDKEVLENLDPKLESKYREYLERNPSSETPLFTSPGMINQLIVSGPDGGQYPECTPGESSACQNPEIPKTTGEGDKSSDTEGDSPIAKEGDSPIEHGGNSGSGKRGGGTTGCSTPECLAECARNPDLPYCPQHHKVEIVLQAPKCNGNSSDNANFCEPCRGGFESCWEVVVCADAGASPCPQSRRFTQYFKLETADY